ncbi:hypothetical protein Tco_0953316, partial [Tanacetum coccineum]
MGDANPIRTLGDYSIPGHEGYMNTIDIMAASAIAISSDSSDESVGSPPSRVILFGDIPIVIPSTLWLSSTSTIALVIYLRFLCFLLISDTACLGSIVGQRFFIGPGITEEDIPFWSPYRTHLNGRENPVFIFTFCWTNLARDVDPRVDSVPSLRNYVSLSSTRCYLLPPRKRFRDSYSSKTSIEEDVEVGLIDTGVDMELGIGDGDDVRDHVEIDLRDVRDDTEEYEADASAGDTVEVGIDPRSASIVEEEMVAPAGEDSSDSSGTRDGSVRSFEDMPIDLDDVVRDFYHHMSEVRIDRIVEIETAQRRLEADQLIASKDRATMAERIYSLRLENLKVRAMLDIERDHVSNLHLHMSLSHEEFRQIRRDRDDARGRLRRLESYL